MSDYWNMFAETGEIGYYLLYLKTNEKTASPENTDVTEALQENSA
jgi:hypothetical protein